MRARRQAREKIAWQSWLSGLAVTLTSTICLFGFWRISPGTTYIIALIALVGLVFALWVAGKHPD
jgi:hypothetical protein